MPKFELNLLIEQLRDAHPLPARSLLVTIFGDAVMPHGGVIWLGSLIKLSAPLSLQDRLVRTAVNRLMREGWLRAESRGRRSYYQLTERGLRDFESADRRIYRTSAVTWDGRWRMVSLPSGLSRADPLRKALVWRGFAQLNAYTFAHPTADLDELTPLLHEDSDTSGITRFVASPAAKDHGNFIRQFQDAAKLYELAAQYRSYVDAFRCLANAVPHEPAQAFALRTLLIHEYRRILLRDPCLPEPLLPKNWIGAQARALCAELYTQLIEPAEAFLHNQIPDLNTQESNRANAILHARFQ